VIPPPVWFRTICQKNGFPVREEQIQQLTTYVELLLDWNRKINLISRRDEENVWPRHILHSISILFKHRFRQGALALDLGTGGGLPGIPLKILSPSLRFVLVDATQKKVKAVTKIIRELHLQGAEVFWGRAEDLAKLPNLGGAFDYVFARAVASLKDLVRLSRPFLRLSGVATAEPLVISPPALVAWKGGEVEQEIQQAKPNNVRSIEITNLVFEGSEQLLDSEKRLIVVRL